MHRSTFHATHTASHKSRRSIDRNLHARFRAQTRITTKSTTLHSVEQRQHALCLEGAVLTGFRTTREQSASLLHHDVTRNSASVRRSVAESVPRLLRNELNQGRFFPVASGCWTCGMDHAVSPSSLPTSAGSNLNQRGSKGICLSQKESSNAHGLWSDRWRSHAAWRYPPLRRSRKPPSSSACCIPSPEPWPSAKPY